MKDYILYGIAAGVFAFALGYDITKDNRTRPLPTAPSRRVCIHAEIEEVPYVDGGVTTMVWQPVCVEWVDVRPGE